MFILCFCPLIIDRESVKGKKASENKNRVLFILVFFCSLSLFIQFCNASTLDVWPPDCDIKLLLLNNAIAFDFSGTVEGDSLTGAFNTDFGALEVEGTRR